MVSLQTERLRTVEQVRAFAEGSEPVDYKPKDRASAYAFMQRTVARFDYHLLGRAGWGCVRTYISKAYGYSLAQVTPTAGPNRARTVLPLQGNDIAAHASGQGLEAGARPLIGRPRRNPTISVFLTNYLRTCGRR